MMGVPPPVLEAQKRQLQTLWLAMAGTIPLYSVLLHHPSRLPFDRLQVGAR
jgi:hypothetical protein